MYLKASFITLILLVVNQCVTAQTGSAIEAHFDTDSIHLTVGEYFSNNIIIENTSLNPIPIGSIAPAQRYAGTVFVPQYRNSVAPGQKQSLRIRMIADHALLAAEPAMITYIVYYKINDKNYQLPVSFYLSYPTLNHISILIPSAEAYFNPDWNENIVDIVVQNQGYTPRSLKLQYELRPNEYVTIREPPPIIALAAGERKSISIKLQAKGCTSYYPDYGLQVQATDMHTHTVVCDAVITIRSLTYKKDMWHDAAINANKNFAEISYSRSNTSNTFYQLKTHIATKKGYQKNLEFSTAAEFYANQNLYNIYDARLVFTTSKNEYAIGNVYGSGYDVNLFGRSARFSKTIGTNNAIEIIGTQNHYVLYSNMPYDAKPGYTIGAKYLHTSAKNRKLSAAYSHTNSTVAGTKSHIATTQILLYSDSSQSLMVEGGLSTEQALETNLLHTGGAAGIAYERYGKRVSLYSNNYFSTPYYAGIRRGLLTLYETIRIQLSQQNSIYMNYSGSYGNPQYYTSTNRMLLTLFDNNQSSNHQAELGWGIVHNHYTINIAPNFTYQQ